MLRIDVLFPIRQQIAYSYLISSNSSKNLIGFRVVAPLRNKPMIGLIISQQEANQEQLKNIIELVDEKPFLPKNLIDILFFISNYYANSPGESLKFILPNKTTPKLIRQLSLVSKINWIQLKEIVGKSSIKYEIMKILMSVEQISFYKLQNKIKQTITTQVNDLIKESVIKATYNLKEAEISEQRIKFIKLIHNDENKIRSNAHSQKIALNKLTELNSPISVNIFRQINNLSISTINSLEKKGLIQIDEHIIERKANQNYKTYKLDFTLTTEQSEISKKIIKESNSFLSHLLFGITGSGKTFVYIDILKHVFNQGKNAIILIPEIALTAQTVARFTAVFGDYIAVLHSRMTDGERYDAWRLLRDGRYKIAIGPRSAILAPLTNIGLIIVDEEHDWSYKQSDQVPKYNARDLAIYRAKQEKCPIILGSATPSIESYQNALVGKYELHELRKRPINIESPEIEVVDLKLELEKRPSKDSIIISQRLSLAIEQCLTLGEQIILFQNKRGYSSYLQCKDCGYINECPNCSISLVYHKSNQQLVCHFCGYNSFVKQNCSKCSSNNLSLSGFGTQKIEELLNQYFPHAKVLRMDSDTTRKKNSHQLILQQFESQEANILVGTQMISKGLDFPNVTLVGVLNADLGLSIPDFRSAERTYQLISQVAGRSGRGQKKGNVIIQSFQPEHYSIQSAKSSNYNGFFEIETRERKNVNYPPFSRLINIRISSENQNNVFESISIFASQIKRAITDDYNVLGPVSSPIERINKKFRWQLLIKNKGKLDKTNLELKRNLVQIKETLLRKYKNIVISIDVDPYDLL